ncbi:unnamed protein product [Miscanthus lutarioriparius]|uniref:Uncharacterized protein n=1 Tax=Miscanthus lutarioriparius TaxID=422564 RepID=A0A811N026_9POAL|nr:unnamed protein product [Miscanthus lutarioriparius]
MRPFLTAAWPCAILLILASALQSPAVASSGAGRLEWQVLTRANFSSQIRLHPHVLLLATMPWYGESRSLMADIERLVGSNEELGRLKLMVVYRNSEKLLTDAIGAAEGINVVYYQCSMQFKYQGKLRAHDILSAVRYIMSLKHEEAPFEVLHTQEDVETSIESTDKSVILYESCGWFTRLAHGGSNQSYEAASSNNHTENVDISGKTMTRESDGPLELVIENEEQTLGVGGQLTGSPWKGGFALANESVSEQIGNTNDGYRKCTMQRFHQFESFYAKLTAIAREYLLPPEIAKYGLITERSLLPSLDVVNEGNQETWFVTTHHMGCKTCSVIVKDGDDLRSLVQSHHNLGIKEVSADESGREAIFPTNRPSVILFIDRLSHSSKVRDESKLVIKLLRQYVQNNYPFHVSNGALSSSTSKTRSKAVPSLRNTGISDAYSQTARLSVWASKLMALGDKMSVMVVNDGDSISYRSSSQGSGANPLYDVLTKLLHKARPGHRSKKTRISLVSRDVGLKMLSDDSEIKVVKSLSVEESEYKSTDDASATTDNSNDDITEVSVDETTAKETEYIDDGQAPSILDKSLATYPDEHDNARESNDTEMEDQSKSEASDMSVDLKEDVSNNADSSSEVGGMLHKHIVEKTVTEAFQILEHDERNLYADQEESVSSNEQVDVSSVLSKKISKTEDAIYENTFDLSEGSEESDTRCPHHATCSSSRVPVRDDTDFTDQTPENFNWWIKNSVPATLGVGFVSEQSWWSVSYTDHLRAFRAIQILYLQMLKMSTMKEELYLTLLLFPAENKSAIAYEGGMSVPHLIEFLESHLSNSRHLLEYKGFMWKKRMTTQHDAPQAIQFQVSDKGSGNVGSELSSHPDVVTGSILTATEKLGTAVPFDNAKVLIVSSDSHEGFHGLIINKRLSWGVFKDLDSSMEPIKHAPIFYGGPVVVQGYHLVSLSRVAWEGYMQVIPGVYYGNIVATSRVVTRIKLGEQSVEDLWFFLGYSGWGYSQLFDELSEGAWLVSGKPIEHLDWPKS